MFLFLDTQRCNESETDHCVAEYFYILKHKQCCFNEMFCVVVGLTTTFCSNLACLRGCLFSILDATEQPRISAINGKDKHFSDPFFGMNLSSING